MPGPVKRGVMSEQHHCPFLNRRDERCGRHLTINALSHAFEHCFDVYAACPVYLDLLIERRTRSADVPALPLLRLGGPGLRRLASCEARADEPPIVQVTVRRSLAYRHA